MQAFKQKNIINERNIIMQDIPDIKNINAEEGIKNCGTQKLFFDLLRDFYKLIDPKTEKLKSCLASGKIREYTIEVHALKNTARMIGAAELSSLFYQLEMLGKAGNKEELLRLTPRTLELYQSYKPILAEYAQSGDCGKQTVSTELMQETLMRLHDSIDAFDMDKADEAMKELETYAFPDDMRTMLEQLDIFMADVAMEEILELTENMCDRLEEKKLEGEDAGKPLIMVVDDDAINVHAVIGMLSEHYRVMSAMSGKEALKRLKKRQPVLILLDVHMPDMSGIELIHKLKASDEYKNIPVIFLTSDIDEDTELQGFKEGADDFIRKPFRKDVARQRIRRIIELEYLKKNLQNEVEKQTAVAEERRRKVERMSLQMVQALANTIDAKDSYTNGHSTRVAKYSVMLAQRMGYTGDALERLRYAALLHDIGKIGVPKEIINKPSRLTDEEYAVIKTHPVIGSNILKEITEIPDISIGARWHHERYDGKGYPDGLKGGEIPELARIIGVADAYDAMTSKRSYRDVIAQEKVLSEVERGRGTQFDPRITDIMLELIKEDKNYTMHE